MFVYPDVESEYQQPLNNLIFEFITLFANRASELGSTNLIQHTIDTQGKGPIRMRPYRINPKYIEILRKTLDDLKRAGIIEESIFVWVAQVVIVFKKNGEIRVCIDYRKLNSKIKKDSFPMPRIDV